MRGSRWAGRRPVRAAAKVFEGFADIPSVEPDVSKLATLDRDQLRDITMNDEELMRDVLKALWDDTAENVCRLEDAVKLRDGERCARLAHYSKGACANLGANRAAAVFRAIEVQARHSQFDRCTESLSGLAMALEELRTEIAAVV